jgi:ABC-type bacteriocin/lantibiotic exporter with double-glycine peptidase domain
MIDPKTQRIIGWAAFAGVLTACGAIGLISQNQWQAALIAVIIADIILLPTFMILLRTRRRTKKIVRTLEDQQQEQLDALAQVGEISATHRQDDKPKESTTQNPNSEMTQL